MHVIDPKRDNSGRNPAYDIWYFIKRKMKNTGGGAQNGRTLKCPQSCFRPGISPAKGFGVKGSEFGV